MLEQYYEEAAERAKMGLIPKPLNAAQTSEICQRLQQAESEHAKAYLDLLQHRVPAGVDEAAYVKAGFLAGVAEGSISCPVIAPEEAVRLLGTMLGGYNVAPLIGFLDEPKLADAAADALSRILLIFDAYHDVVEKAEAGLPAANRVLKAWADATWFTSRQELPTFFTVTLFKVPGETNTDDLSPATDAWSRPDIPLHALSMYKVPREGVNNASEQIAKLSEKGYPVALTCDVLGTGSSRKSATNSVLWYTGEDIPYVPNKRAGGVCIGGKIAPIFFNTMEDSGALPIECDVSLLQTGDVVDIYPYLGRITRHGTEEVLATFELKTPILLDEVRAGGRIPLIIGRALTARARQTLGLGPSDVFRQPQTAGDTDIAYTLAQKMVGKACGKAGVSPGEYCEPHMTTVGSQDTTGPMTRDELKDLACLGFSADLVMQSFCHTAAYPKPVDVEMQKTLPDFIMNRGGVSLRPGDGIIHSWLNRMLLPDTVGTGGDSHTRFPLGISFPAGSGLVAFAAATGVMPLDMPESVLVRFVGTLQPGITLRDLVHAIPYFAIRQGLLTVEKKGKKNIFSGRILEIEGLPHLKVEQAFELADASAERSAAGCTVKLDEAPVIEYLQSNVVLLKSMIAQGYGDERTLKRRIDAMLRWLEHPELLEADPGASYAATLTIDMNEIVEPIVCCPNDPDDARLLSDVAGTVIDEVFLGSCMTNIGHFRAAGQMLGASGKAASGRLWIAPPTRMDQQQLEKEGVYDAFAKAGARTEVPGCSLCMGNQARVADHATVVSTSTRNFPNRLGNGANVYLASAELASVCSVLGRIPTLAEYQQAMQQVNRRAEDTYRYLNFDQMTEYQAQAAHIA